MRPMGRPRPPGHGLTPQTGLLALSALASVPTYMLDVYVKGQAMVRTQVYLTEKQKQEL